jgi:hypothetical protein
MTTAQQAPEQLTWKRQPMGEYVARHGFWVYTVFRNTQAAKGRQWVLEAYPEGNMDDSHARTGFDTARTAKTAALGTHCFICGRTRPFGTLKRQPGRSQLSYPTWVCRDEKPCRAERDRLTAERERKLAPGNYASALQEIVSLKARVRKMETDALTLRTRAIEVGVPEDEIRQIESAHSTSAKVCIACEQPQGEPHLSWCPVVTGKLSTLPTDWK